MSLILLFFDLLGPLLFTTNVSAQMTSSSPSYISTASAWPFEPLPEMPPATAKLHLHRSLSDCSSHSSGTRSRHSPRSSVSPRSPRSPGSPSQQNPTQPGTPIQWHTNPPFDSPPSSHTTPPGSPKLLHNLDTTPSQNTLSFVETSPTTPFTLSSTSLPGAKTASPPSPLCHSRSHKSYLQYSVPVASSHVPKHSMSSSRMSRHLHLTSKSLQALQSPASLDQTKRDTASEGAASSNSSADALLFPAQHAQITETTQDTLAVNIMSLPKGFHQQNLSLSNLALTSSTRTSLMSVVPSMANVWLEDDDDDDELDEVRGRKESIIGLMRSKHLSTNSLNKYDTEPDQSFDNIKRRTRKNSVESRNMFDKIKKTFSSKTQQPITTDSIKIINPLWEDPPAEVDEASTAARPSTPPSATRPAYFASTPPRRSNSTKCTPSPNRSPYISHHHASHMKTSSQSSDPPSPRGRQRSHSSAIKLRSLLSSKNSRSHLSQPSMDSLLDKKQISAPVNFVHTAHVTDLHPTTNHDLARLKLSQPDRQFHQTHPEAGMMPTLSCTLSSSLQGSSLQTTTGSLAVDNTSVSTTTSVEECSPVSSVPSHKQFFSTLQVSPEHPSDQRAERALSTQHSIDSLGSHASSRNSYKDGNSNTVTEKAAFTTPRRSRSNTVASIESGAISISAPIATAAGPLPHVSASGDRQSLFVVDDRRGVLAPGPLLPQHQHQQPVPEVSAVAGGLHRVHEEGWF